MLRDGPPERRETVLAWYVYMVRCADGTLYTGTALDVTRRIALHNEGKGAKYTRGRRPVCEIYRECCADRSAALRREAAVKRLSRQQKLQLAASSGQGRGGA
ncbi:MAG TPA: GIY-YIG nuclease family protein [Candidatus Galloscillospira excrementipullorum]|nr:GIY-YIG nuclease family protein [Candidatus Galloscillospira excrementipullorum]